MILAPEQITRILLGENYITKDDLARAEKFARTNRASAIDYLLSQGLITKDILGSALAEYFKVSYANLNSSQPAAEQVKKIPEEIAKKYRLVLFKQNAKSTIVATDNPQEPQLPMVLKGLFPKLAATIAYSLPEDIDLAHISYHQELKSRFGQILSSQNVIAPQIMDAILEDAILFKVSDIHFEPQEQETIIRFRVDGVLHEAGTIPKQYYENVLNWVKVQAHLRTDEHASAQDGAIRYTQQDKTIDIRISIAPTVDGEKIVMRLLAKYVKGFSLTELGLSAPNQAILQSAIKKPFGMVLAAGPTGSGKTTTLYALIKILNRPEVNIATIEDPVEYKIKGVNHIQINPQTNLTFAKGLRSIVRQDPNIILVGEIRDEETAEIAVNAALTGQLLLSSFHANDASTAVTRLLDMDIEPFLLASTLNLIIAQRLVRKLCDNCRATNTITLDQLKKVFPQAEKYFPKKQTVLYRGKGCNSCSLTGYKDRTAIFEIIEISRSMQDLILKNPSNQEVWQLAQKEGARSLFDDGIDKVKNGITTLEELLRVAQPPKE